MINKKRKKMEKSKAISYSTTNGQNGMKILMSILYSSFVQNTSNVVGGNRVKLKTVKIQLSLFQGSIVYQ